MISRQLQALKARLLFSQSRPDLKMHGASYPMVRLEGSIEPQLCTLVGLRASADDTTDITGDFMGFRLFRCIATRYRGA